MADEIKRLTFLNGTPVDPPTEDVTGIGLVEIFNTTISNADVMNGLAFFRAPRDLTFDAVVVTLFTKDGVSSGNLIVDIKKGALGALASIFSALPTFDFSSAADYSEVSGTLDDTACTEGEFFTLDLTSKPSGWNGNFHVSFYGIA